MRKFILIFTIVFIVTTLACFSVAPVAFAADGDVLAEGSAAKTPTMADRVKEWWGDFANKELTVFGISFTVQTVLLAVLIIIAKKAKSRLLAYIRDMRAELDKVRKENSNVMSELSIAHKTYLKIEKNAKIDEIVQHLDDKTEPVNIDNVSAPVPDAPAEVEASEDPSPSIVSRPIV